MKYITKNAVKSFLNTPSAGSSAYVGVGTVFERFERFSRLKPPFLVVPYFLATAVLFLPGLSSFCYKLSFAAVIVISVVLPLLLGRWGTALGVVGGGSPLIGGLIPGFSGRLGSVLILSCPLALIAAVTVIHLLVRVHEKSVRELAAMALVDHLTGLYNLRTFERRLEEEWMRSRNTGIPMVLMVFDVDRFKQINDTLGHGAGDDVLRGLGERIRQVKRAGDIPFRIGGDEFAVVMPSTSRSGGLAGAERMVGGVRECSIMGTPAGAPVTISLGIADAADAESPQELREQADKALYDAKRAGRNRYRVFGGDADGLCEHIPYDCRVTLHHVQNLLMTITEKDRYTYGHSRRVCRYTKDICIELGLPEESVRLYQRAALVCDVGNVEIPASTLLKTEPLTKGEWDEIMRHPLSSARIIKSLNRDDELKLAVLHHHERYDGSGYPEGMRGSEIPLGAQILNVADAFDAMCSKRPYRPPLSPSDAFELLEKGAGVQFSPEIVAAARAALGG